MLVEYQLDMLCGADGANYIVYYFFVQFVTHKVLAPNDYCRSSQVSLL